MKIALKNVDLSVHNVARSLEFYTLVLDMTDTPDSAPPQMLILSAGSVTLSLHQTGTQGGRPVQPGSVELAFQCDDLEVAHARFLSFGLEAGEVTQYGFGSNFEARDPDGYAISVYTLRED